MIPSFVLGAVFLIGGLILKYARVQRNPLFGYRTYLSMKNEDNWEFANKKAAIDLIIIGVISLAVGCASLWLPLGNGSIIFGLLILILVSIIRIEVSLRKFDRGHK